jgi:Protein of unknown function (DUF3043)
MAPNRTFRTGTLICVFRRRSDSAPEAATETVAEPKQLGKGRPTPKRSEAEKRRRQPITAPRDRKEAYRQVRERQSRDREKAKAGMARGENRYLPKRDQGPVRAFARDYVDSRRTFAEFFMYIVLAIVIFGLIAPIGIKGALYVVGWPLMLVLIVGEAILMGRRITRQARERFPDEEVRGLALYTATRAMQIRRFRMPQARLKPGMRDQV